MDTVECLIRAGADHDATDEVNAYFALHCHQHMLAFALFAVTGWRRHGAVHRNRLTLLLVTSTTTGQWTMLDIVTMRDEENEKIGI